MLSSLNGAITCRERLPYADGVGSPRQPVTHDGGSHIHLLLPRIANGQFLNEMASPIAAYDPRRSIRGQNRIQKLNAETVEHLDALRQENNAVDGENSTNSDNVDDDDGRSTVDKALTIIKGALPHIGLVGAVMVYLVGGAFAFQFLEANQETDITATNGSHQALLSLTSDNEQQDEMRNATDVVNLLLGIGSPDALKLLDYLEQLHTKVNACSSPNRSDKQLENWNSTLAAILFTFTAASTIGYGHIYPVTTGGKLFCIAFTLIGIPLFMITVANIGKFIWEAGSSCCKFFGKRLWCGGNRSEGTLIAFLARKCLPGGDTLCSTSQGELSIAVQAPLLILCFVGYIAFGAAILPMYEELDFVEAMYFCFISVTTVGANLLCARRRIVLGFGDVVPENPNFVLVTLVYIFIGLSLTTLAIEVLATAFRKIHYVGRKIKEAGNATIWFGDKLLTVNDLVRSVGRELGVSEDEIAKIGTNLDVLLSNAAEEKQQSGKIAMTRSKPRDESDKEELLLDENLNRRLSGEYDNIPETWKPENLTSLRMSIG